MGRQKKQEITYSVEKGNPLPLGVSIVGDNINIAVETDAKSAAIVFYPKDGRDSFIVEIPENQKVGNVRHMSLSGICLKDYDYNYSFERFLQIKELQELSVGKFGDRDSGKLFLIIKSLKAKAVSRLFTNRRR